MTLHSFTYNITFINLSLGDSSNSCGCCVAIVLPRTACSHDSNLYRKLSQHSKKNDDVILLKWIICGMIMDIAFHISFPSNAINFHRLGYPRAFVCSMLADVCFLCCFYSTWSCHFVIDPDFVERKKTTFEVWIWTFYPRHWLCKNLGHLLQWIYIIGTSEWLQ